ncbi:MAG: hypothetical protein AB8F94_19890 [Saprospiraceae bacterium]
MAFFCLIFSDNLNAQNDDYGYVVVEYMKVKPGMWKEYRECEKVWKTIHQARVKAGYITGWQLERVLFPSGTDAEYDFVVITNYKNWKAIGAEDRGTYASLFKALPGDKREIANKAVDFRDLVKKEIWRAEEMIFAKDDARPRYAIENFMSIPTGGWDKWMEMETTFAKPFIKKSMEMGNRAGWLVGNMVLPRGDEFPYQASTIDFYDTWEDMGKSEGKAWQAVYGNMDNEQIGKRIQSSRTIVKSEVRELIDFVK